MRRILAALQEGSPEATNKLRGKSGVSRHTDEVFQERQAGSLHGGQCPKPFLFLSVPQVQPLIELVPGNGKTLTETFHRREAGKTLRKDTEDKEKSISGIRNDEIWKDGMGSAAVTDKTQDDHLTFYRLSIYEIDNTSAVISMDMAVALCSTTGTGFQLGAKRVHVGVKEDF